MSTHARKAEKFCEWGVQSPRKVMMLDEVKLGFPMFGLE